MRFLVDAQLPRRLVYGLREAGHDALHTLDLPAGNRTTDEEINRRPVEEERVVITKDADFVDALLVRGLPYKLLLISTGNIRNSDLERLLLDALPVLETGLQNHRFVELDREAVRVHL